MKIDEVDFFYLSMPEVLDIGDGSQDALLVRVRAGEWEGWGECEASPLTSIAAWCCPRSHSACKPVCDSVLGAALDSPADILEIGRRVNTASQDVLQADHTLSGIEMALWDLLGRKLEAPAWKLLGYSHSYPKTPYASQLFGDTPQETLNKAKQSAAAGYRAAKFGWGPYGSGSVSADRDHVHAAREGLGDDGILLVDAGTVWRNDLAAALLRLPALTECGAVWLEEPFSTGALEEYSRLAAVSGSVKIAGGEGSHNVDGAILMMKHGGVGFIQIDAGRIGGLGPAKAVADYASSHGVTYVNHTFTSHLALSASLQPYAGIANDTICEYPVELKSLARDITQTQIMRDANGDIQAPSAPGLGIEVDTVAIKPYLLDAELTVAGKVLYRTPKI